MRACSRCGAEKPFDREHYSYRPDGSLRARCRACDSELATAKRWEGRERPVIVPVAEGMKRCSKCGQEKPADLEHFARERRRPSGLFSWCRDCQRADAKQRRLDDPEHARAIQRASVERNRPNYLARQQAAYRKRMADPVTAEAERERTRLKAQRERASNPEKANKRVRDYRARHIEVVRARGREMGRERYRRDPAPFRASAAKQRAARAQVEGEYNGKDLNAAFRKQNGCCIYCGSKVGGPGRPWHADHFIPISRGGTNHPENIVIACDPCNRSKHNKMPWEWMPDRFSPPNQQVVD
jgi:5-methylcytosine-specific restriction endonuclease McrA